MSSTSNSEKFIEEMKKPRPEAEKEFFFNLDELAEADQLFQNSLLDRRPPL